MSGYVIGLLVGVTWVALVIALPGFRGPYPRLWPGPIYNLTWFLFVAWCQSVPLRVVGWLLGRRVDFHIGFDTTDGRGQTFSGPWAVVWPDLKRWARAVHAGGVQ